jgi:hypothetical protein
VAALEAKWTSSTRAQVVGAGPLRFGLRDKGFSSKLAKILLIKGMALLSSLREDFLVRKKAHRIILLLASSFSCFCCWGSAPANDNFADRLVLKGTNIVSNASITEATIESAEPKHVFDRVAQSIWWTWTAPFSGGLQINARASSFYKKAVVVYTGDSLVTLQRAGIGIEDQSAELYAEEGKTYHIVVATEAQTVGNVILSVQLYSPPPNDNFRDRIPLGQEPMFGSIFGATTETGELVVEGGPPFGRSVWWEWTAPADGIFWLEVAGLNPGIWGPVGTDLFEGNELSSLQPFQTQAARAGKKIIIRAFPIPGATDGLFHMRMNFDGAHFTAPVAARYEYPARVRASIGFSAIDEAPESIEFSASAECGQGSAAPIGRTTIAPWEIVWENPPRGNYRVFASIKYVSGKERYLFSDCFEVFETPPPNDQRSNAIEIPAAGGSIEVPRLSAATLEVAELELWPDLGGGNGSVWWHWRPERSGEATIIPPSNVVLRVFAGATPQMVPTAGLPDRMRFQIAVGEDYWIGIRPKTAQDESPSQPFFVYMGKDPASPINDDFNNRLALQGAKLIVPADTSQAVLEVEEANLNMTGQSIWWSWTAPANGIVRLEAIDPGELAGTLSNPAFFQIAVYRGDTLNQLAPAQNETNQWTDRYFLSHVTAGEILVIRSASRSGLPGRKFLLRAELIEAAANDLFSGRKTATGLPLLERANIFSPWASSEPGESLPRSSPIVNRTLWWEWTAPLTGTVGCMVHGLSALALLTVYEGNELNALALAPGETNRVGLFLLQAVSGHKYQFQVAASADTEVYLHISGGEKNDRFADAAELPVPPEIVAANNFSATHEPGESTNVVLFPSTTRPLSGSLWWTWTAPRDGLLTLRHRPATTSMVRRQWTGDTVDKLVRIGGSAPIENGWMVERLQVNEGQKYRISLDTLAVLQSGQPVPGSMLLDHNFRSFGLQLPEMNAAFSSTNSIPIRLAPVVGSYEGEMMRVEFHFSKRPGIGGGDQSGLPHNRPVVFEEPPFFHSVSNWPPGVYSVVAYGMNRRGDKFQSIPRTFSIAAANDFFEQRPTVSAGWANGSSVFFFSHGTETLAGSGLQKFEAGLFGADTTGSVWWQWKAEKSSHVFISTGAPVAVFRGRDIEGLEPVGTATDTGLEFEAEVGVYYQIALLRRATDMGADPVSFTIEPGPENDRFEKRQPLNVYEYPWDSFSINEFSFYTARGTLETNEPDHGLASADSSVWWSFQPPRDGSLRIGLSAWPQGSAVVRLYEGETLTNLTPVTLSTLDQYSLGADLRGLHFYQIAVVSSAGTNSNGTLRLNFHSATANDVFAMRSSLSGYATDAAAVFWSASVEPEEPQPTLPLKRTIWWEWTAPATGGLNIIVESEVSWNDQPVSIVELFTGNSLSDLRKVDPEQTRIDTRRNTISNYRVQEGTTYMIRAGIREEWAPTKQFSSFRLELAREWPLLNETYDGRKRVEGASLVVEGNTTGSRDGALWYSWSAPYEGTAVFRNSKSDKRLNLQISHRGAVVSVSDDAYGVHVRPGEEVVIAATPDFTGEFAFSIDLIGGSPNDEWESPRLLSGSFGEFTAEPKTTAGRLGPNGEALDDRRLYWKWTAPFGGGLHMESFDGTPAAWNVIVAEENGNYGSRAVVTGRTYQFMFIGIEGHSYRFWVEPDEWHTAVSVGGGQEGIGFQIEGPENGIFRLDASEDLSRWETIGFHAVREGRALLQNPSNGKASQFYRLVPIRSD